MRATRLLRFATSRLAAAGGHGHPPGGGSAEYGGFHAPHVAPIHKHMATGVGAIMWFWLLYRSREDGAVVLGFRHPWDHGDHHGDDHGHGGEGGGHGESE